MAQLYRRHASVVYAYALRATGQGDLADEVVQETFIRAFRALPRFEGRSAFRTWLFSIAVNCGRTQVQKAGRRAEAALSEDTPVEGPAPKGWLRRRLTEALAGLPDGYREVVIMHDVLEMGHEEIAEARQCSIGTSKSQLHKARAKLRTMLAPMMGGLDA